MAKQRGVLQLSGRVDNLCYYQQKRVRGGLVRRVNLAMSERVKSGSEYTRLRTANSYFGACSMCAAAILNMTGTRAKFLHYPNRQALLTKAIYDYQSTFFSGRDVDHVKFVQSTGYVFSDYYDKIVKNKMSKYMPSVPNYIDGLSTDSLVTINIPRYELEYFCHYNKCVGVSFSVVYGCYLYNSSRNTVSGKFVYPDNGSNNLRHPVIWELGMDSLTLSFDSGSIDDAFTFAILSALPVVQVIDGRAVTKDTGASTKLIGLLF